MYLITKEKYLQNLQNRFPDDDMTILDPFTAAKDPVSIQCNKCGQVYHYNRGTTLYSKRRKYFCPLCNSKSVKNMVEACIQENISIVQYKTNVTDSWDLHCNKCNKNFSRAPATWQQYTCPYCGHNHLLISKAARQNQLDEYFGKGEFEILDETPTNEKITVRHKCGFIRKTQMAALLRSDGCPRCNGTLSHGERLISLYLELHNINYVPQAKMGDTKQSFDFLVNDDLAIEFNGKQHYEPIAVFGGEERFIQQQVYDKNKQKYCQEHNIQLVIIPYYEINNINTILDNIFKKFNDQSQDVEKN